MTPEREREIRANQIVRHAVLYGGDADFRKMVDNTVYLTPEQQQKSITEVDKVYGATSPLVGREYGA